jgi:DNA-binding beta-propeller fold protein YncE
MSIFRLAQLAASGRDVAPEGAWDMSYAYFDDPLTGTLSNSVYWSFLAFGTYETNPQDMYVSPDGTMVFLIGSAGRVIDKWDLSIDYMVPYGTYAQTSTVSLGANIPRGLFFKPDGTQVYILDDSSDIVIQRSLSTAWDLSTISTSSTSFSVSSQTTSPFSLSFKPDGTKMYVLGGDVHEYNLSTAWNVTTASYVQSGTGLTADGIYMFEDGTGYYLSRNSDDTLYHRSLSTPWDISTSSAVSSFSVSAQDTLPLGVFATPTRDVVTFAGSAVDRFHSYVTSGYKITAQPFGLSFKPDGTKMYHLDATGDAVYEYNLSTAYDMSTASFVQSFSVVSQETIPRNLTFKPDGTKMYVTGQTSDSVHEYNLGTAWNISTAVFSQSFSVSAQHAAPSGIVFKSDGTKMFIVGSSADAVSEYILSTAWDVSTASFSQSFSVSAQDLQPVALAFKPDGKKMYVTGTSGQDRVLEYSLSTAWDVSSASYFQAYTLPIYHGTTSGIAFNGEGTKMFTTDSGLDRIYTHTIGVQP